MNTQDLIIKAFSTTCIGEWDDNIFIPLRTTHGERKQFWTNYDKDLVDRISEIKAGVIK